MAKNGLYEEVTIAGFGGQGIILVGKLLAQAAMKAGGEVAVNWVKVFFFS